MEFEAFKIIGLFYSFCQMSLLLTPGEQLVVKQSLDEYRRDRSVHFGRV